MRKATLALIICLTAHAGSLYAFCKSEACKQATAWKNGYTAIVLDDKINRADYFAVLDAVKANKGVVAIEAERVLLGWIPITSAGKIRGVRGVSAVLYGRRKQIRAQRNSGFHESHQSRGLENVRENPPRCRAAVGAMV